MKTPIKKTDVVSARWSDGAIVQGVIAQIPWRSNLALLDKLDDSAERATGLGVNG